MNREIKFRGKSKKDGKWLYGYLGESKVRILNTEYCEKVIFNNVLSFNSDNYPFIVKDISVENDTVGQYTGLKDKNGVEIYEGDILEEDHVKSEIMFIKAIFYACIMPNRGENTFMNCALFPILERGKARVIGNIHDNPELLEL